MNGNPSGVLNVLDYPMQRCVCGCPMVGCPVCASPRCLHCDPFCEDETSCHDPDDEAGQ